MTDEKEALPSDAENGSLKPNAPEKDDNEVLPPRKPDQQDEPSKRPS